MKSNENLFLQPLPNDFGEEFLVENASIKLHYEDAKKYYLRGILIWDEIRESGIPSLYNEETKSHNDLTSYKLPDDKLKNCQVNFEKTIKCFETVCQEIDSCSELSQAELGKGKILLLACYYYLACSYYAKGTCKLFIDRMPSDVVLQDYLKALDLGILDTDFGKNIKVIMSRILANAFEIYWLEGPFKKGLLVCHYIEKYIDPDIVNDEHYKNLKRRFETNSAWKPFLEDLWKNYNNYHNIQQMLNQLFSLIR